MTSSLRVLAPGFLTTVQDLGRGGYQHLGVAVGGALDAVSLRAANALVGNPAGTGALEALYVGPTLVVEADSVRLAFVGANAAIEILPDETAQSGTRIDGMRSVRLRRGQMVRIGPLSNAAVLYVAVEGGCAIEPVLGSLSTYMRGGLGGWQGRALAAGDKLPLRQGTASDRGEFRIEGLDLRPPARYRAVLGPQDDYFSAEAIKGLFENDYTVSTESDRMGMRLAGYKLDHRRGFNIVSDGIAPGSIQVPGDGQPIVLLADRQTTGGYPKIATVISADLPALGRIRMGGKIAFQQVTIEEAQSLRRKHLHDIDAIRGRIVPLTCTEEEITAHLFESNLISGAVDAYNWT
jgi:biotin-dependent carboxylase-like uncharacterized protein